MLHHPTSLPLPPGPRTSSSKLSPPLAELLVLTLVAAWVCYDLAAFDRRSSSSAHSHGATGGGSSHKIEALILFMLALAGHAGMGPSQFRFAADSGIAMGLIGVPCMLASLFLVSDRSLLLGSLLHASLTCSASVAVHHFLCLPISDVPSSSTSLAFISTTTAKLALLAVRLLLPWPDRGFTVVAFALHELLLWGVVEVPLFTASFTLGEAMMIVQALALTTADALCCTALEAGVGVSAASSALRGGRDAVLVVLQCGLIGAVGSGAVILPLFCREARERRDMNGVLASPRPSSSSSSAPVGSGLKLVGIGGGPGNSTTLRGVGSESSGNLSGLLATGSGSRSSNNNNSNNNNSSNNNGVSALDVLSSTSSSSSPSSSSSSLLSMGAFLAVFAAYVGAVMFPWISFMIHRNPLVWVLHFVTVEDGRWKLCALWVVLLVVFVRAVVPLSSLLKLRRILVRKLFHVLAVVMFMPATLHQPRFLALAYAVALSALLVIEYVRMSRRVLWVGGVVHAFYSNFLDERDMGNLVVTHLYLLLGCAFPLWVSWLPGRANPFVPYAGILALGIGDAAAATLGCMFGKHRWPSSNRTLEGSAAMVVSMALAILMLEQLEHTPFISLGLQPACGVLVALLLLTLLEAFTCQIDNLVLPVFAVTLLNLAFRFARDCSSAADAAAVVAVASAAAEAAVTQVVPP